MQRLALSPLPLTHERFELIARLGAGAHGEVFEAYDRLRGTRVALKTLRNTTPDSILRFKREFRALVQLHHPHLVEYGELFEQSGQWFFSMELVEGVDFLHYVRGGRPDPHDWTFTRRSESLLEAEHARLGRALIQLGQGLAALHRAGKIHRDIKPSNIRIRPDGRLTLLDFGLVAPAHRESTLEADHVVGTIGYMAPEQAGGRPLSPATDAYAVGILIYEALVGELPFSGSALDVLRATQSQPVLLPAELTRHMPPALVALCHELCQLEPARRPSIDTLIRRASSLQSTLALTTELLPEPPEPTPVSTSCYGRERELALLEQAATSARAGTLTKVLIEGTSGLGKTTLLSAFRERVVQQNRGSFVLNGSCHEQERVAYKAFDAAIDELGSRLERLTREQCAHVTPKHVAALVSVFPVLGRLAATSDLKQSPLAPDPITLRAHAYAALRDLLHRIAERTPVVLILDDLHWSDDESLELLWALFRAPDPPPILLIASLWPEYDCAPAVRNKLTRVFDDQSLSLTVGALPPEAAAQLARELLSQTPERDRAGYPEQMARAAACNPLYIEVLAHAAGQHSDPAQGLDEALLREFQALSDSAQKLLQLVAVAGAALAERLLAQAAELTLETFARSLAELRRARLARVFEHAGEFCVAPYHGAIRAAVLMQLSELTLRRHHLALARALSHETYRDPETLAIHWAQAGESGHASRCYAQAADNALRTRAFGHAAELYRSALAGAESELDRRRWLRELGSALAHAGRSAESGEAFVAAAEVCEPNEARALLQLAAEQFVRTGEVERGLEIARPLLAEIGESLPASTRGATLSMFWQRARVAWHGTRVRERPQLPSDARDEYAYDLLWSIGVPTTSLDLVRGVDLHSRCLLRALRLGEPGRLARSLATEALYMRSNGSDYELRVRGVLGTADSLARRSGDPYAMAFSELCHAIFFALNGEPRQALTLADAAAALFEDKCQNVAWEIATARSTALGSLSYLGRFRELETRFHAAAEEAEMRGNAHVFTLLVTLNRCTIDLAADRPEACRADLERVMSTCPSEWYLHQAFALGAHVLIDLYCGGGAAHRRIETAWRDMRQRLILDSDRLRISFLFFRGLAALSALAAGSGDARSCRRLVERCAARLAREKLADAVGGAAMLRAQLATHARDWTAAVKEYRAAAELWARLGMYGYHIANLRLGEILGGPEGAALIAGCMTWAHAEGVRRPEHFFRVCAPVLVERAVG